MNLHPLKVIELGSILAVPAVGMFLAELGADVLKIENKATGGDTTRFWRLAQEPKDTAISAYYASVNWGKRVEMLDLHEPAAQAYIHGLVRDADIVLCNFKPSSAAKLQMDYARLSAINPALIYANLTGFGNESNRAAFDVVLQAETGFMFMNGQPDSPPTKMPVALIDVLAAHQLKEGILLALLQRQTTGKGALVETSLYRSALASLANQATNWLMANHVPQRAGSLHPNIAPYGEIFKSQDHVQIVVAIGTDNQFLQLCILLDCKDLAENPAFATNAQRVVNRQPLAALLQARFDGYMAQPLLEKCHQKGVPVGQICDLQQVFASDEAQAMILSETTADGQLTRRIKTVAFDIK